jgi:hypothetical protein
MQRKLLLGFNEEKMIFMQLKLKQMALLVIKTLPLASPTTDRNEKKLVPLEMRIFQQDHNSQSRFS